MKKTLYFLLVVLILPACQPTAVTAVPTVDVLAPYYGTPQPVKAIIDGKTYDSEIGTSVWVHIDSDGNQVTEVSDAFAIITSTQPIVTKAPFSLTLKLPIPINPTVLWYAIFEVTQDEINSQDPMAGFYRWYPNYEQQSSLPLLAEQELTLSLDPGTYVLEVHAGWGRTKTPVELDVDYGFLIEVQE